MPERDWKKRMHRRVMIRLVILLLLLALIAGVVWVFLLPYLRAESHMASGENLVLRHISSGEIELSWPEVKSADYYRVEVFHEVEVENKKGKKEMEQQLLCRKDLAGTTSCVLPKLPWDEELTIRVNTMVIYEFPGEDRVRLGESPIEVTICLQPPTVSQVHWEADTENDSIFINFYMDRGHKARLWHLDENQNWKLLKTLDEPQTTVTFGEKGDLPMLEHGQYGVLRLDVYREGQNVVYYSMTTENITVIREDLLDRDLRLELTDQGDNVCTLTWNETKGEYYELQMREHSGDEWITICTVEQTGERSFTTEHLKAYRDYSFRVVAQGGQAPEGAFAAESEICGFRTAEALLYSTIWPLKELNVYSDPALTEAIGKVAGGTTLCVAEVHEKSFGIPWNGGIAYIESNYVLIDLAEYLGELCAYDITNSYYSRYTFNKYAFPEITGRVIVGYEKIKLADGTYLVPLLYPVAQRLLTAAQNAYDAGYRLKIYDSYRPNRATVVLYNKAEELLDKPVPGNIPDPTEDDPERLLTYGNFLTSDEKYPLNYFLAQGASLHNLGIALDLTIEKRDTHEEMPMQSQIHDLTHYSMIYRNNENAKLLKGFMEGAGFGGLVSEWWHFQDNEIRKTLSLPALWNGVSPEGWKRSDGGWRYRLSDGSYACGCTMTIGDAEYTFDEAGYIME